MRSFKFRFHHMIFCLLSFLAINTRSTRRSDSSFSVYSCFSVESNHSSKTFQTNLKLLLSSLTSNAPSTSGFYTDSIGETPDGVHGLALCRGDIKSDMCSKCLTNIINVITQRCMESTQGLVWYDYCLVRYSNHEFFGAIDTAGVVFQNQSRTWQEYPDVDPRGLIWGLVERAPREPLMFATNKLEVKKKDYLSEPAETRYGLVQCTRDLSSGGCRTCLNELMKDYKLCCEGMRGWRIITGSCSIRYDDHPFFVELANREPLRMLMRTAKKIDYWVLNPNKTLENVTPVYPPSRRNNYSSPAPQPTPSVHLSNHSINGGSPTHNTTPATTTPPPEPVSISNTAPAPATPPPSPLNVLPAVVPRPTQQAPTESSHGEYPSSPWIQ